MMDMFKDRAGRFPNLMFFGLFALPLVGLMIMDYQLQRANDITGEFLAADSVVAGVGGTQVFAATIIGLLAVFILATIIVNSVARARSVQDKSLAQINQEIDALDRKFKDVR